MIDDIHFSIYVYLNNPYLALDDRTVTGIANAMRTSKDTTGDKLHNMLNRGLLEFESVGNSKVYFVKVANNKKNIT